jgi:hypothetical protein
MAAQLGEGRTFKIVVGAGRLLSVAAIRLDGETTGSEIIQTGGTITKTSRGSGRRMGVERLQPDQDDEKAKENRHCYPREFLDKSRRNCDNSDVRRIS